MKKLNKITAAFASLALAAAAFIGCVDSYPDNEPVGELGAIYLRGSMNDWEATDASKLVAGDTTGFYSVTWQAKGESETFKFADSAWGTQYCQYKGNASYVSNVSGVEIASADDGNGGENDKLTGLSTGSWYKFSVVAGPVSISVTVEEAESQGGVTSSDPVPYYLDGYYLVGCSEIGNGFSFGDAWLIWGATTNKKTGEVTYTKDFVFDNTSPCGWHSGADAVIKLATAGWGNSYSNASAEIKAGGDAVELTYKAEGGDNTSVTGLKNGSAYRAEIKTTPEGVVTIKVYEIAKMTLSFKVKGLTEGNVAWMNGTFWGSGWPQGWPIVDWNSGDQAKTDGYLSAHNYAEADASGVATFDSGWNVTVVSALGEELSYMFKAIASSDDSWADADVFNPSSDLKCTIKAEGSGNYLVSVDASTEEVTVTKQ